MKDRRKNVNAGVILASVSALAVLIVVISSIVYLQFPT
jgi:hypothetical protein